ncbi:MAG: DUF1800 domain-containing protein [Candidatus Acidiferrales bacterium]
MRGRVFRRLRRPAPRRQVLTASLALSFLAGLAFVTPIVFAAKNNDTGSGSGAATEVPGAKQNPVLAGLPITDLTEQQAILHALDRLSYGLRPGDVERVERMGLAKWVDQQLHPESIDDSALDARLQIFPTLNESSGKLIADFPRPQEAAKREGITVEEYRKQQQDAARAAMEAEVAREGGAPADSSQDSQSAPAAAPPAQSAHADATPADNTSAAAPNDSSMQASTSTDNATSDPLDSLAPPSSSARATSSAASNQTQGDASSDSGQMSNDTPNNNNGGEMAGPPRGGTNKGQSGPGNQMYNYQNIHTPQRIVAELAMAKVDRAVYSERQLYEQMVDFWFNHFNIYVAKGQDAWLVTSFERDAIRPHAMGKFRDLLEATAKSPAMLFYLDNWLSVDPDAAKRLQAERQERMQRFGIGPGGFPRFPNANQQQQAKKQQDRGLNENYGRELMELHTLGVDGGYTQQDVTEVARCFTGWTISTPRINPEFQFNDRLHDTKPKLVLGHKIDYGGIKDGEAVLDLLASDPHTAHHISLEIAQHFVADKPPDALVDRMTKTYLSSDGDIRAVLHTMIYSPEFWSKDSYRAKIKTPFELVVSAARATGADATIPLLLVQWSARIGEPLYQCQPPTGYSDMADAWVNTGALLNRLNYSLALTGNRLRGVETNVAAVLGDSATGSDAHAALDAALTIFLGGEVSAETRDTLEKQLDTPQVLEAKLDDPVRAVNADLIAGLVLGSPEFQRR